MMARPFKTLAAPSWVMPGNIAENARFLAGKVDEVALLFLQTKSSLAYSHGASGDLLPELAALPLTWHVHLPSDLPWRDGDGEAAGRIAAALMDKAAYLGARRAVLHPPSSLMRPEKCLKNFARAWEAAGRDASCLLLENIRENDLADLAPAIRRLGLGVCLDFGHMLAYNQTERLFRALPDFPAPAMVHWNAPVAPQGKKAGPASGPRSGHGPLTLLAPGEVPLARRLLDALLPGPDSAGGREEPVMVLECFAWKDIEASLPLLRQWAADSHL